MEKMEYWTRGLLVACLWMAIQGAEGSGTTCPCGDSKKGRIVGGSKTLTNQYPWAAMVVNSMDLKLLCGATIISKTVAIGAASCTKNNIPQAMSIVVGTSDASKISTTGQIVLVENKYDHEGFSTSPENPGKTVNDISLLIMSPAVEFNADVGPACLPVGKIQLDNKWVKVLGWGRTSANSADSKQLMQVDMQVKSFSYCKSKNPLKEPQTQICVEAPGKSVCLGDAGGPMVYLDPEINRFTLVGVVSVGNTGCGTNAPIIGTEVSAYLPWIQSKIKSLGCQKVQQRGKGNGNKQAVGGKKKGGSSNKRGRNDNKNAGNQKKTGTNIKKAKT